MFDLIEVILSRLAPGWARLRKEQSLLAPIEAIILADDDDLLN